MDGAAASDDARRERPAPGGSRRDGSARAVRGCGVRYGGTGCGCGDAAAPLRWPVVDIDVSVDVKHPCVRAAGGRGPRTPTAGVVRTRTAVVVRTRGRLPCDYGRRPL